ncbi:MAG TPA: hypothetical protein DC049_08350 [Spirochaetia bacterium]|nr:hypothetical protein [Spirochaetia bacterium]
MTVDLLKPFYENSSFSLSKPYSVIKDKIRLDMKEKSVHFHKFLEIIHFPKGAGIVSIEGTDYPYDSGTLVFIKPYAMHSYKFNSFPQEFVLFELDTEIFSQLFANAVIEEKICKFLYKFFCIHPVQKIDGSNFLNFISSLSGDISECSAVSVILSLDGYLENLLIKKEDYESLFSKIISYIYNNYDEKISLEHTANQFGLSKYYFSRRFRQIFNISFTGFINKIRVEKARDLLLSTKKSVTEVAHLTGFSDTSYFIKVFKKFYHKLPSAL